MQSLSNRTRLVLLIIIILLAGVFLYFTRANKNNKPDLTGEYYDPNSQTIISNPAGKTPETFGSETPETTFIGFDQLLNYGLGNGQLDLLRTGLNEFNTTQKKGYEELSLTADSVQTGVGSDAGMDFNFVADRSTKLSAKLTYPNIDSITLTVSQGNAKLFFKEYLVQQSDGDDDL